MALKRTVCFQKQILQALLVRGLSVPSTYLRIIHWPVLYNNTTRFRVSVRDPPASILATIFARSVNFSWVHEGALFGATGRSWAEVRALPTWPVLTLVGAIRFLRVGSSAGAGTVTSGAATGMRFSQEQARSVRAHPLDLRQLFLPFWSWKRWFLFTDRKRSMSSSSSPKSSLKRLASLTAFFFVWLLERTAGLRRRRKDLWCAGQVD